MRGTVSLLTFVFSFYAYGQCPVETSIPDLGETGDTLQFTTNLSPADWKFSGPDGDRLFEGSPIDVNFAQPGTYSGLLAGQNLCEETIRIEFQVRIFDLMGEPEIQINGGADFTNKKDVTVDLLTTGAIEYLLSDNANCRTGEWKPMAASGPFELTFENTEGRVFAKFRTPIEESACVSDSIVHDDIAPIVNLTTSPDEVTNDVNARFVFDPRDSGSGVDTMLCGNFGPADTPCDLDSSFQVPEGPNTLVFRARDNAGNLSPVYMYDWRVDITKPTVEITEKPAVLTNDDNARFEFKGSDSASEIVGYTCQLDAAVVECDSPKTYKNLAEGQHSFAVIAQDEAGNKSDPAIYAWTIDSVKPTLSFTNTPNEWEPTGSAVFEVLVNDASSTVLSCRVDNGSFKKCTRRITVSALADGEHELEVFATDAAGNVSETISYEWNVDTMAPVVVFTDVPESPNNDLVVEVEFKASDAGIGVKEIRCQFDNDPVFTCTSPLEISNLQIGMHQIQVFAIDELNNQSAPISYSWETKVEPPVLAFTKVPASETNENFALISFLATSQVNIGTYACSLDGANFTDCNNIVKLQDMSEGNHTFSAQAFDEFGQGSNIITHNWFIDSIAPVVTFTDVPDAIIELPETSVSYSVVENGSGVGRILCKLDDQDEEECQSPFEIADLSEGNHTVSVRAEDKLGNMSETISTSWEVSLTLPTVSFTKVPPLETPLLEAEFEFVAQSNLGINRIECDIDGSGFSECVSPTVVDGLSIGSHRFSVRAIDRLERPSDVITYDWKVIKLPDIIEEEFVSEGGSRKLDLMFVVDNSGSMYRELTRTQVRRNFKNILGELKGLDWQIGLITTDGRGTRPGVAGRLAKFYRNRSKVLTPSSKKPENDLMETISRVPDGSNYEEGIWSLQQSLERSDNNVFFRDDAVFMAIIFSDEDEGSNGTSSKPKNQPEVLLQKIKDRWGENKASQFHAIIWRDGDKGCSRYAQRKGLVYNRLVNLTGGKTHSICKSKYIKGLKGYSSLAKAGDIVRELQCEPVDGEYEVNYSPEPSSRPKVTLSGNQLRFSPAPANGTVVKLKYACAKKLQQLVRN